MVCAVVTELTLVGFKPEITRGRNNHLKIQWYNGVRSRAYFAPSTPSDFRSVRNARAEVRRMLRADCVNLIPNGSERNEADVTDT